MASMTGTSANAMSPAALACRICGSQAAHETFPVTERMYGSLEGFDYFQCPVCLTLQIHEVPDDLGRHYPADSYYSFYHRVRQNPVKLLLKRIAHVGMIGRGTYPRGQGWLERVRSASEPWVSVVPGLGLSSSILDVGCGDGARLETLAQLGFRNLAGIDKFLPAALVTEGDAPIRLFNGDLEDHVGSYDLVTLHHSLEHVPDPRRLLEAARARLRPGGTILVRIPLFQDGIWARFGPDWVQLDPPRHLYLFAPLAFEEMAARAGLKVVAHGTDMQGWSLAWSEAYKRGISMVGPDGIPAALPFTLEELQAFDAEARRLNAAGKGDQGYFALQPS